MAFPDNFINELVERNDIVDVVGSYVRLGKKSCSNMFGLCPFHSEKTPSFSVSPDKQIYHCFGCGKGGGVISFIMEVEGLNFPEAVEFLAKRVGMPMPEETNDAESKKRARMLALNKDTARFFYEQLSTPAGAPTVAYIRKRQLTPATVKSFGLGAAPDTWDSLRKAMKQKGYTDEELFAAGLVRRGKNGGFYDTFRNRLMFPVIDVKGNVIGFSGRILGDGEPKYMNSPETLVFNKSRNLFALNLAKKSKCGYIILTEGNIDVASLHQAGFDCAVASLGTSFTPEQARLISRYTNQVIIAYDNDNAGIKAAQRGISILEQLDVKVKVLRLTGAKDPDEFIKLRGADAFRNLLEGSENQVDYRLRAVQDKYDLSSDEQKVGFLKEASDLVARLPSLPERQVYAMRVAAIAGVPADVVAKEAEQRRRRILNKSRKDSVNQETQPEKQLQSRVKGIHYDDPASATAEEGLIRLLYLEPALIKNPSLPSPEIFSSEALGHIYSAVCERLRRGDSVNAATMGGTLGSDEMSLLVSILQKPENLSRTEQSLTDYIARINEQHSRRTQKNEKIDLRAMQQKYKEQKGYEG